MTLPSTMPPASLVLEDGRVFRGRRFGAPVDAAGEVVFNTSMTGYQEILGDPSYAGQLVVMTYPMIGNYGIAPEDFESRKCFLAALIVKEPSRIASNWRHDRSLGEYLAANGVPGLSGFDTRSLVRHLRTVGALRGVIADGHLDDTALIARARAVPSMAGCELASRVSNDEPYGWTVASPKLNGGARVATVDGADGAVARLAATPGPLIKGIGARPGTFRVVCMDYGIKWNILRRLVDIGCQVTVVPADTTAKDVLALKPDGIVLSNGPGDPEPMGYAVREVQALIGKVPVFGICLGHQILGLAAGGRTYKLKFGHHGGNHPVMDLTTRKIEITSHNHGFAVDPDSLGDNVERTHIDLNDQTLEGLRLKNAPAFSVQYHPEAAPGPHDATYLFSRFAKMMKDFAGAKSGKP